MGGGRGGDVEQDFALPISLEDRGKSWVSEPDGARERHDHGGSAELSLGNVGGEPVGGVDGGEAQICKNVRNVGEGGGGDGNTLDKDFKDFTGLGRCRRGNAKGTDSSGDGGGLIHEVTCGIFGASGEHNVAILRNVQKPKVERQDHGLDGSEDGVGSDGGRFEGVVRYFDYFL